MRRQSPSKTLEGRLCPHFGLCGGCTTQDRPYDEQLAQKASSLRELFSSYWDDSIDVVPSPCIHHYRNRVDFNFGRKFYDTPPPKDFVRETVLGFKRRGRWYQGFDVQECVIGPEGTSALLDAVREWARDGGLQGFDSRTRQGLLKILLVREGKRTGQRMVVLITGDGPIDGPSFVEAVQEAYPATSIHHAVSQSPAGVAFAEHTTVLRGEPSIEERLRVPSGREPGELRFRLSPFGFFQTNTLAAEHLYGGIREWVGGLSATTLYDLYGGSGGIAMTCAGLVDRVVSVESVPAASEDGRHNVALNGISNVTFVTDKVKNYLRDLILEGEFCARDSVVIADPPRPGLHPKALRRLLELQPAHILYVSCKPPVLARDEMPSFLETYRLQAIKAFDMFPHTPHVEVMALLSLK